MVTSILNETWYKLQVGNFGLARTSYPDDYIGTGQGISLPLRWMAPEFLTRLTSLSTGSVQMDLFKAISKQTSIWSLGVLVNEFKFRE